jgi:hypothetical protein
MQAVTSKPTEFVQEYVVTKIYCTLPTLKLSPTDFSVVSDYGLDDRAIGVRFPAGAKDFSCILCVHTVSGAHPASCTMGTGSPFPGGKSAAGA